MIVSNIYIYIYIKSTGMRGRVTFHPSLLLVLFQPGLVEIFLLKGGESNSSVELGRE